MDSGGVWATTTSRKVIPSSFEDLAQKPESSEHPEFALEEAPPKWTAPERKFLARVREECREILAAVPKEHRYGDAYGDRRLLRFLRQTKNADKALAAAKTYAAWRREKGVDVIRAKLAQENFKARDWPHGSFLLDRFCVLPCSSDLCDEKGNALCVEQYGFWPADRLRDITADKYLEWQLHCLEYKCLQLENIAIAREKDKLRGKVPLEEGWGEVARLCTIFDMRGLTFSHALLPFGFKMVKQLIPMVQKYYPWLQDTTHLVNASSTVYSFWHTLKPLLPKHTQRKIFIYSADAAKALTAHVRPESLPTALGGRAQCDALVPPPTVAEYDERQRKLATHLSSDDTGSLLEEGDVSTDKNTTTSEKKTSLLRCSTTTDVVRRGDKEDINIEEDGLIRAAWSESCALSDLRQPSSPDLATPRSPFTPGSPNSPNSPLSDIGDRSLGSLCDLGDLSPTGRVLSDHLAAGGKTLVIKHSRRGSKSRRYLTCADGLIKLTHVRPSALAWRTGGTSRHIPLHAGLCVAQGQHEEAASPDDLEQFQRRTFRRAATTAPNVLVVGTRNNNSLVLEFATDEEASIVAAHIRRAAEAVATTP